MATVQVIKKNFIGEDGKAVEYERLAIVGYVSGEIHTLELKLSSSEIMLAKMLLSSNEEKPVTNSRKAEADELKDHSEKISRKEKKTTDKTILDEDEDEEWLL